MCFIVRELWGEDEVCQRQESIQLHLLSHGMANFQPQRLTICRARQQNPMPTEDEQVTTPMSEVEPISAEAADPVRNSFSFPKRTSPEAKKANLPSSS